jgi:hypothetical protein
MHNFYRRKRGENAAIFAKNVQKSKIAQQAKLLPIWSPC